jgi:hypothetical protein
MAMKHDYERVDDGPAHEWWRCRHCGHVVGRPDQDLHTPCPYPARVYGDGKLTEEGTVYMRRIEEAERKTREEKD